MLGNSRFSLFILVVVVHSILLIYVVLNFIIATFMDPGRFPKGTYDQIPNTLLIDLV